MFLSDGCCYCIKNKGMIIRDGETLRNPKKTTKIYSEKRKKLPLSVNSILYFSKFVIISLKALEHIIQM